MKDPLWKEEYKVNTLLINPGKRLGLVGLLGILQDTAGLHATSLGWGYEATLKLGIIWVLLRQRLIMSEWPEWGETVKIVTWARPLNGIAAIRDFEVLFKDRKIGECVTQWMMIDRATRRPVKPVIDPERIAFRKDRALGLEPRKLELKDGLETLSTIEVRNSDLDVHEHVNNTRYAQWILDSVPLDAHRKYRLLEYEVNFLNETRVGDRIRLTYDKIGVEAVGAKVFRFQGAREADGKTAFAADLRVEEI